MIKYPELLLVLCQAHLSFFNYSASFAAQLYKMKQQTSVQVMIPSQMNIAYKHNSYEDVLNWQL